MGARWALIFSIQQAERSSSATQYSEHARGAGREHHALGTIAKATHLQLPGRTHARGSRNSKSRRKTLAAGAKQSAIRRERTGAVGPQ